MVRYRMASCAIFVSLALCDQHAIAQKAAPRSSPPYVQILCRGEKSPRGSGFSNQRLMPIATDCSKPSELLQSFEKSCAVLRGLGNLMAPACEDTLLKNLKYADQMSKGYSQRDFMEQVPNFLRGQIPTYNNYLASILNRSYNFNDIPSRKW